MLRRLSSQTALCSACQCSLPAPAWAVVTLCLCPEASGHLLTARVDFLPFLSLSLCSSAWYSPVPKEASVPAVAPSCSYEALPGQVSSSPGL